MTTCLLRCESPGVDSNIHLYNLLSFYPWGEAMGTSRVVITRLVIASAIVMVLASCGGGGGSSPTLIPGTATAGGYNLSVFITAPTAPQHPDSIVQLGSSIFIAYQNAGEVKDGSVPGITNAVVQYDLQGNL